MADERFDINNDEDTIDVLELVYAVWDKIIYVIIAGIIGVVGAFLYTTFFVTPMYESTSMIYVYTQTTSITSMADLQIGSQLTIDFQIVATTREVLEAAAADIGYEASYEKLVDCVTIENPDNSRILKITVENADPALAARLSNSIANQLRLRIADVMNTDKPSVVQTAVVPINPVSPSIKKNTVIGGAGLAFLVIAVIVVIHLLDDTIKGDEDVEKYLHQNVIAIVPYVNVTNGKSRKVTTDTTKQLAKS